MKALVVLSILFFTAEAKPKQRICEVGRPFGHGACKSSEPYCEQGYDCIEDVCCKSARLCPSGKPEGHGSCAEDQTCPRPGDYCLTIDAGQHVCCSGRQHEDKPCPIGNPWGYGACDLMGNCPDLYSCINDVCCSTKKDRVCPTGKPGGYGICGENDECLESNNYCYSTASGDKICCNDETDEDDDDENCTDDPCASFTCSTYNPDELFCRFDPATCKATIKDAANTDVTSDCFPDNTK